MRQMRKTRVDVARMTLPRRALGSTGIEVSAIGLGTVKLGRNTGLSLAPFAIPGTRAARALLDRARELGVNLLDTAPAYGESEARLGELLDGTRDRWVLCTKAGESFDGRRSRHDFRPEALRESVEASLRRLRTDYLDIVLIHSDGRDVEILRQSDALETLDALKREGKVRASGFSHKTEAGGRLALSRCDVLMSALSFTDRRQIDVVRDAGENGVGVLVKKALDSGRASPESLRYVAGRPGVSSVVVGTVDPAHLEADIAAAGFCQERPA